MFLIFVCLRSESSVQESSETLRLSKKESQEKKTTEDELGYKYETSAVDTVLLPGRLYGVFHQTDPSEPMAPAHHALTHFSIAQSSVSFVLHVQSNLQILPLAAPRGASVSYHARSRMRHETLENVEVPRRINGSLLPHVLPGAKSLGCRASRDVQGRSHAELGSRQTARN